MVTRIALLGAGSARFTRKLVVDCLHWPELANAQLVLHDIDPVRLEVAQRNVCRVAELMRATPIIEATTDRRQALDDADFVINLVQVGGFRATQLDFEIARQYGVRYAINDTINSGGVMRGLRTVPVFLDILRDMKEVCPTAFMLNYANPMSMLVWAGSSIPGIRTVGLCHSVDNTVRQLASYLGVPYAELTFNSAGVNHLAFITSLQRYGEDLYPALRQLVASGGIPDDDLVRAELCRRLGFYPTESSEHHADYNPWFIPKNLVSEYRIPIDELIRRDTVNLAEFERIRDTGMDENAVSLEPSGEYAASVIRAIVTGSATRIVGNVMNDACVVPNLPAECCAEVPCYVDALGIHPVRVAPLPVQCVAYLSAAVQTQALLVKAIEEQDRSLVYHAVAQDPQLQSRLTLDEVWRLTDDLIAAEAEWLPTWLVSGA